MCVSRRVRCRYLPSYLRGSQGLCNYLQQPQSIGYKDKLDAKQTSRIMVLNKIQNPKPTFGVTKIRREDIQRQKKVTNQFMAMSVKHRDKKHQPIN